MNILVTGGSGFIGSNFIKKILENQPNDHIINMDVHTYAARPPLWFTPPSNLTEVREDIRDQDAVERVMKEYAPEIVYHFAAESHVCRSIRGPKAFVTTNVVGTFTLLQEFHKHCPRGRFVHISTDEVFGQTLDGFFTEKSPMNPRSPYAASKAAAEMLVRSWIETYGTDAVIVNMCNIFGPNQHEEKLIPMTINRMINGLPVTVYGNGVNMREWMHVDEAIDGVFKAAFYRGIERRFCLGTRNVLTNMSIVQRISRTINSLGYPFPIEIEFKNDRPTDDIRYALNPDLAERVLKFSGKPELFDKHIIDTVSWYLNRANLGIGRDAHQGRRAEADATLST
jgi:dTDP-glucose 4,6-dehydratase